MRAGGQERLFRMALFVSTSARRGTAARTTTAGSTWSEWLTQHASNGLDVFAYFNNDAGGHAPRDAVRLRQRMQKRMAP